MGGEGVPGVEYEIARSQRSNLKVEGLFEKGVLGLRPRADIKVQLDDKAD